MTGNNVSHANNKNKRRFIPNLQRTALMSVALGQTIRIRLTTSAISTNEHNGGLDEYLKNTKNAKTVMQATQVRPLLVL